MSQQVQSADLDEEQHKNWCDSEISKNQAILDDKGTKLQRLSTKIDNEKEMVSELDQDLQLLEREAQSTAEHMRSIGQLRLQERNAYVKSSQNRQMAMQILSQATMILQRFNALVQEQQQGQPSSFLQMQVGQSQQIASVSASAIDGLTQMSARYEQLRSTSDQADNQAQLDMERFGQLNRNLADVLQQTRSYKSSLRLQSMSELDSDTEDKNALKTQVDSVSAYVDRLRHACTDILSHYDERKVRREEDIRALSEAKGAINIDGVQEEHGQLEAIAQSTDSAAQQMLSASQASFATPSSRAVAPPAPPAQAAGLGASINALSQLA